MYCNYPQPVVLHCQISIYPHVIKLTSSEVNISLGMANLHMINILSLNFCTWQHLEKHWNESQLQHLASIPSVPVGQLYSHMATGFQNITPFSPEESTGDTDSIWTLFSHTGVCVTAMGLLIPAGLGIFCCYFISVLTCQISTPDLYNQVPHNIQLWMMM